MSQNIESNTPSDLQVGIALSGGGFRASVFHIGVFKALAEHGYMGNIKYISSVSGGSFTIALIFKLLMLRKRKNTLKYKDEKSIRNIHQLFNKLVWENRNDQIIRNIRREVYA